ncbi:MAG: VWA domain-containing protein, partial [Hyphomicrobiales bacterium]|nr:VWA domain-containing protein [Hyphomicrobiales bacterium]
MTWRVMVAAVFLGICVLAGGAVPALAQAAENGDRPLLMEGKKTIFQRVLTRPGATLAAEPGVDSGTAVTPFTVYYVYGRKNMFGADWVEVGTASRRPADGWVAAEQIIDWKQTVTVSFTPPSGRERTLLFRDRDKLVQLLESETVVRDTRTLREQALAGPVAPDFPVISIEPAVHVDIKDQFYLLPILGWEEAYLDSGFTARLLEVASVTLQEKTPAQADTLDNPDVYKRVTEGLGEREKAIRDYRVGLTFVIDTTTSMGPYIDRTREAIRAVFNALDAEGLTAKISFGLIGFRDNVDASPGLEYVARTFADLQAGADPATFMERVEGVRAAEVSSKGFIEDAFAGVVNAAEQLDWSPFGGRYMVLITDAGARRADDPLSRTGMDAAEVRRLAADRQIAVVTLHLLTEEGRRDHARAAQQYRVLSRADNGVELYFPVETGSVEAFSGQLQEMTRALTDQIRNAVQGKMIADPGAA